MSPWRKLPACGKRWHRKLEAYATCFSNDAWSTPQGLPKMLRQILACCFAALCAGSVTVSRRRSNAVDRRRDGPVGRAAVLPVRQGARAAPLRPAGGVSAGTLAAEGERAVCGGSLEDPRRPGGERCSADHRQTIGRSVRCQDQRSVRASSRQSRRSQTPRFRRRAELNTAVRELAQPGHPYSQAKNTRRHRQSCGFSRVWAVSGCLRLPLRDGSCPSAFARVSR